MPDYKWVIGEYYGKGTLCVNLYDDGKMYHRHDYGSRIFPRWIRLGWYIRSIEKESGCLEKAREFVKTVLGVKCK